MQISRHCPCASLRLSEGRVWQSASQWVPRSILLPCKVLANLFSVSCWRLWTLALAYPADPSGTSLSNLLLPGQHLGHRETWSSSPHRHDILRVCLGPECEAPGDNSLRRGYCTVRRALPSSRTFPLLSLDQSARSLCSGKHVMPGFLAYRF